MQTFLPYPDFRKSLQCLDTRRLGKQRVEAFQLIDTIAMKITGEPVKGWRNHPATLMWSNNLSALIHYYNTSLEVWSERGYKNVRLEPIEVATRYANPRWFGDPAFHLSHRSNLLRKNPEHYRKHFPEDPDDLPYVWPA